MHAWLGSNAYLQATSDAFGPTDSQPTLRQNSDGLPSSKQPSNHARLARAQAAARLSTELQEVLRHATLAMLHLADADAVIGLQRHCLYAFGGLHQLTDGSHGRKDGSKSSSSLTDRTVGGNADGRVGKPSDAVTAVLLHHPHLGMGGDTDQRQFDWLEGIALQVS